MRNVFRSVTGQRVILIAILLAMVSSCFAIYTQVRYSEVTACQARINQTFLTVIKERSQLSNENNQNINSLIVQVFKLSSGDKAAALAEYKAYLTELDKVNNELRQATYPNIGDC
jgi:hypothetical protein